MEMSPLIALHLTTALAAVVLGPVALWARQGARPHPRPHPRLHRAFSYAWVTVMLIAAGSAVFIRDFRLPNIAGYTPIHLLVPLTLGSLFGAFWMLARGNIRGHRPVAPAQPLLKVVQASVGSTIRMVPVEEVLCCEAADKYVRVLTADHEYLIRTPLKDLLPQLDPQVFWQVHRGTVVRAAAIEAVHRDAAGKLHLVPRGRPERLPVSRLYAHLFKAM